MTQKDLFAQKLRTIKSELNNTQLLIVSKTRSIEEIKIYYELGHRDFGENRVQELLEKSYSLQNDCPEIRWHMIGNIQTNKVNQLFSVTNLYAIHSVDDRELVEKMIKAHERLSQEVFVFLQFNTSHEAEKSGFETYTELEASAELLLKSTKLKLKGLMTMGTLRTENFEAEAGRCFQDLQVEKEKLQNELNMKLQTSMGMSQDYKIAVREKSDWVRLGTMMFQ